MSKVEIVDLTVISQNFPQQQDPEIFRDEFITTIETMLEGEVEVVFLEGKVGIGKTTILSQFAREYRNNVLSLFIRPTSRMAYDPDLITWDLCNQIEWVLNKKRLEDIDKVGEALLKDRIFNLQREARLNREYYYFILDGVLDIPEEESYIREQILNLLPIGRSNFCFVVTGDHSKFPKGLISNVRYKSLVVPGFNQAQSASYFSEFVKDGDWIREVHHTFSGVPGYLASLRRMLEDGESADEILDQITSKVPSAFEMEWERINQNDEKLVEALAFLAYAPECNTVNKLSSLIDIEEEKLLGILNNISFLDLQDQGTIVRFVTESFRMFITEKLQAYKDSVFQSVIDYFLNRSSRDEESRQLLPEYYSRLGRHEDLLKYLSTPEHFPLVVEQAKSFVPVLRQTDMGLTVAKQYSKDIDLIKYSSQKSMVLAIDGAKIWRSEVEALMALGDEKEAISLAQTTVLIEDKLELLAVIAKRRRAEGRIVGQELQEQIIHLYKQLDTESLGKNRAVEIASELMYIMPELAIELMENVSQVSLNENMRDWVLTKLKFIGKESSTIEDITIDVVEEIRGQIKDPEARSFFTTIALLLGEYSPREVIDQAEDLVNAGDKLFFLRQWIVENRESPDSLEVVEYALNLVIQTTEYSPSASFYREIAVPLPFAKDSGKVKTLVDRLDGQKATIQDIGPTEEYIRLQIILSRTEAKYDINAAYNRIDETFFSSITSLNDVSTQASCLARLYGGVVKIDFKDTERKDDIVSLIELIEYELDNCIEILLKNTGFQYKALKSTIRALARHNPEKALDLAQSLNTLERRDIATRFFINNALDAPESELNIGILSHAIFRIQEEDLRDGALLDIVARLADVSDIKKLDSEVKYIINNVKKIKKSTMRCNALALAYKLLLKHENKNVSGLRNHVSDLLKSTWEDIDIGWQKVDFGFRVVRTIAPYSQHDAFSYLQRTHDFSDDIQFNGKKLVETYLVMLRLTIRAFRGLLKDNLETEDELARLCSLIERIPSFGEKAKLWSEVALNYVQANRTDECSKVVSKYLKPCLSNIPQKDIGVLEETTVIVAPSLFYAHQGSAIQRIEELSKHNRDKAYANICEFMLCKKSAFDPYRRLGTEFDINYEEALDIMNLSEKIESDFFIYRFIEDVVDIANSKFSRQQKARIAASIEKLVEEKLPDNNNIEHDGYKIIATASLYELRVRSGVEHNWRKLWDNLYEQTQKIPNISDRAYVLCILASKIPKRTRESKNFQERLFEESKNLVESIPSISERLTRYESLAESALNANSAKAKEYLKRAYGMTIERSTSDARSYQRRIIDAAYRIDPDFASSLVVSFMDDDPARVEAKKRLTMHENRQKLIDCTLDQEDINQIPIEQYVSISWALLGDLNAGRIQTRHLNNFRELLLISSGLPLKLAYPILAWSIENAVVRFDYTSEAETFLRPLYHKLVIGTELSSRMAGFNSEKIKHSKEQMNQVITKGEGLINVKEGEREKALQYIENWLKKRKVEYIKISDPYFGPSDLECLKLLLSINPDCQVTILTSVQHQKRENITSPWSKVYREYWRLNISEQSPPHTEIIIIGTESSGEHPIHDRWWVTAMGGLRFGTSFNSLGDKKISEISTLSQQNAREKEEEVDRYVYRKEKLHLGERIEYTTFYL